MSYLRDLSVLIKNIKYTLVYVFYTPEKMEVFTMKHKLIEYIRKNEAVSYAELERFFEECGYDYKGNLMCCSDVNSNVIFWVGWNIEAFSLINELIKERKIHREPCQPFIYFIDGKCLSFPIVKNNTKYKTIHWLPCIFVSGAD